MDPALAALCNQTVVVYARTGSNSYAEPTYSTSGTSYAARVVTQQSEVRSASGEVKMSSHVAWLDSAAPIAADSKWLLPDGTFPQVLTVTAPVDETGAVDHVKVVFGH